MQKIKRTNPNILVLVIALSVNSIIVLSSIATRSLWNDEAASLYYARFGIVDMINEMRKYDKHPPFYYILLKLWMTIFGDSEFSLRFPSFIFGLLFIVYVYKLTQRYFDPLTCYLSISILSTFPLLIRYQQEARMYTLLPLLVMGIFYHNLKILEKKHTQYDVIYWMIFSILAIYTHYFAIFVIFAIAFVNLLYFITNQEFIQVKKQLKYYFMVFLSFLPWMLVLLSQSDTSGIGGAKEVTLYETRIFLFQSFSYISPKNLGNMFEQIILVIYFVVSLLIILKANFIVLERVNFTDINQKTVFVFLEIVALMTFLLPYVISVTKFPLGYSIYNLRYLLIVPFMCKIIFARSLVVLGDNFPASFNFPPFNSLPRIRKGRSILAGVVILVIVLPQFIYLGGHAPTSGSYREAVNFIENNSEERIPVVIEVSFTKKVYEYYFNDSWDANLIGINYHQNETVAYLADLLQTHSQIWYTMAHSRDHTMYVYHWFLDHDMIDPTYGLMDFDGVKLFKIEINHNI